MDLIELGRAFQVLRKAAGDNQEDAALATGVDRTTISKFESGRLPEIGFSKVERLYRLYGQHLAPIPVARQRPTLEELVDDRKGGGSA